MPATPELIAAYEKALYVVFGRPELVIRIGARADAEAVGRAFGQNAIVFVEKGRAPELVVLET